MNLRKEYLNNSPVETIYIGGGTPSLMYEADLKAIVNAIYQHFRVSENVEFTMEANPEQCTSDYLKNLKNIGVNRISIGIQSLNNHILDYLGRKHTAEMAIDALENAHKAGFENISLDLIYGIPLRSTQQWIEELQYALKLPIQHLSAYALTIEENSILIKRFQKEGTLFNFGKDQDEDLALRDFKTLLSIIEVSPLNQYEISNFAIPGFESKHNSNYWNGTPYLGLGPSAHSFNGHSRCWNIASIKQYIEIINSSDPVLESEELSNINRFNEAILLGLRTIKGIILTDIQKKFGEVLYHKLLRNIKLLNPDWYQLVQDQFSLTQEGLFLADFISEKLFLAED
jgi:putative oxygen-independent coproporphyrinogen III oxidase